MSNDTTCSGPISLWAGACLRSSSSATTPGECWGTVTSTEESSAGRSEDFASSLKRTAPLSNVSEKSMLAPAAFLDPVSHALRALEQRPPSSITQQYATVPDIRSHQTPLPNASFVPEHQRQQREVKIRRFRAPTPIVEGPPQFQATVIGGQQLVQQDAGCNDADTEGGASGLQLVHLLLACADAIDALHDSLAHVILMRLRTLIEPQATTMQRLAHIFVTALTARVTRSANGGPYEGCLHNDATMPVSQALKLFELVYNYTPLGKFPHTVLNQIILESVEKDDCIHIIDLNAEWRGMQWPALIHALALRPGATPRLRITAFGRASDLAHSQTKLHLYAQNLQFSLEYCPIAVNLREFDLKLLDIREGEAVCINSFSTLHQYLSVGDIQVHKFLCDLKSLNPRVLAISDNDADHNSPAFLQRFVECFKYYSAVFDSLEACIADRESLLQIERLVAGRKIRNIIACDGDDRIERHESMASWNRRMLAAGFQQCPVGIRAISQASVQLTMYHVDGFTLRTKGGYVGLGWKGIPLVGIAAWCTDHCSSSHPSMQHPLP